MAPWLIFRPHSKGAWEQVLGHPLRGPVVLDRETPEEAIRDFAEREGILMVGLAAVPAQGHRT